MRIIYGAFAIIDICMFVFFLFIIQSQKNIFNKKLIKFKKNYILKINSEEDLQLLRNDCLVDKIKTVKGNFIIYYLIGDQGYYIFNIITGRKKFYTEESIPAKEMRKIRNYLKNHEG